MAVEYMATCPNPNQSIASCVLSEFVFDDLLLSQKYFPTLGKENTIEEIYDEIAREISSIMEERGLEKDQPDDDNNSNCESYSYYTDSSSDEDEEEEDGGVAVKNIDYTQNLKEIVTTWVGNSHEFSTNIEIVETGRKQLVTTSTNRVRVETTFPVIPEQIYRLRDLIVLWGPSRDSSRYAQASIATDARSSTQSKPLYKFEGILDEAQNSDQNHSKITTAGSETTRKNSCQPAFATSFSSNDTPQLKVLAIREVGRASISGGSSSRIKNGRLLDVESGKGNAVDGEHSHVPSDGDDDRFSEEAMHPQPAVDISNELGDEGQQTAPGGGWAEAPKAKHRSAHRRAASL